MKKPWSPLKAGVMTALLILVGVLVVGGVWAAVTHPADPEATGEKLGRILMPVVLLGGLVAYFVQRSRQSANQTKNR